MTPPDDPDPTPDAPLRVLLVEDDDGDAVIVQELLQDAYVDVDLRRVPSVAAAQEVLDDTIDCVLLDLGLPDAAGVAAVHSLRRASLAAIVVLTGLDDEQRGLAAVDAGAQDYLVKGQVESRELARALRYALARRRGERAELRLAAAELQAAESSRLERGLLPEPLMTGSPFFVQVLSRPGRQRALLGGDFYDAVQDPDGCLRTLIGDVSGHGADEAALGVSLRIAWRTLVLAEVGLEERFGRLQEMLVAERHEDWIFATATQVDLADDGDVTVIRAGHPAPLVLEPDGGVTDLGPASPGGPPLGTFGQTRWDAYRGRLAATSRLLLYTDGLVEGRAAPGADERLGAERLAELVARRAGEPPAELVAHVLSDVQERHGGPLPDDAALVLIGERRAL